jgi:RNA polymerase sigma-70 factor (ECF subfamily)
VYVIAARKVADVGRARRARRWSRRWPHLVDTPDAAPGPGRGPGKATLPTGCSGCSARTPREIVVLRVVVGLPAEEVAVLLDTSAGAVRLAQHRALAKLRALAPALLDGALP